ncbi:nucleoporin NUP35-like isoform X1 [Bolinopsis microptera]|uniref:nucleoporin NUP35-like isoform X1 n=1 Tax=Bolinopsis microptera TaxID=2820187 RepID=UPI00307A5DFF
MSELLRSPSTTPQQGTATSLPGILLGTPKSPSRTPVCNYNYPASNVSYNPTPEHIRSTSPSRFAPKRSTSSANKENCLPTESLYDSVLITDKSVLHRTPERQSRQSVVATPITPGSRARSRSPARRLGTLAGESMYEEPLPDTWVTVFGFPSNSSESVLQHFSQFGKITKFEKPSQGNWLHLMFESKIQARKALSRSGSVLNRDIMIGVVPCTDQRIKSSGESLNSSVIHTPKRHAKPHEVAQDVTLLPRKDEGILYRMVGYVLGW